MRSRRHAGVLAAGLILALSASVLVLVGVLSRESAVAEPVAETFQVREVDHSRGSASAPILLIEYADPECTYCKKMQPTMDRLYARYGQSGEVRFVYRHFLLGLWSNSEAEAQALECAAQEGGDDAFFAFLTRLFAETNSENDYDISGLPDIANALGLDADAFLACQETNSFAQRIQDDKLSGKAAGVRKTPTFFIVAPDGYVTRVTGNRSYQVFESIIEAALSRSS